ncbi:MAG: VCBS repeat-containing protein [Phycisphaeraceae bacterium]|nr:VCBS repeat-containing protein [Phycisphaeraceae bacterium]
MKDYDFTAARDFIDLFGLPISAQAGSPVVSRKPYNQVIILSARTTNMCHTLDQSARTYFILLLGLLCTWTTVASAQQGPPLVSGQLIMSGAADGAGPLSAGVSLRPMGYASLRGGTEPDIFVAAGNYSDRPGLLLFRFVKRDEHGTPMFADPVNVAHPGKGNSVPTGVIFQTSDKTIHGFWLSGSTIQRTILDGNAHKFIDSPAGPVQLEGLPRSASWLGVNVRADGSVTLLLGISDGASTRPSDPGIGHRHPDYRPYDGAGVWRGGWPVTCMYAAVLPSLDAKGPVSAGQVSATQRESLLNYGAIASVNLGSGHENDIITGSHFGNFIYYHAANPPGQTLAPQRLATDAQSVALRYPALRPTPIAYPNPTTGMSDLIVGSESCLYYYHFTGNFTANGAPIFDEATPVLEKDAFLYAGSLPVVNVADWDGDGALDMVAGNSQGFILFFRNRGDNRQPVFLPGTQIEAEGEPIQIQPGYMDVQGPQEARWGYICPTVVDWNEDGLLDIITSSATTQHLVYLNRGTPTQPKLDRARLIYCYGLDLHGTWRVRPGVAKMGSRMAYVTLDDQDEFHLYWRIDDYNVSDGGKLTLENGKTMSANFLPAGATGRSKIMLTDWDLDGKVDLLVATPRHGSIPDKEHGLPQSLGLKGSAVVFLRNVGDNDQPRYTQPTLMQFQGKPIYKGQHACSAAPADFGDPDGPNLIVTDEQGRFFYYARRDLSWGPLSSD